MIKLFLALSLFSSPVMAEEVRWPSYCIRSVTINEDDTFLLDMPGWPFGMDDRPILITSWDHIDENTTNCSPDDPRMNQ
jgi:hypothetical protein